MTNRTFDDFDSYAKDYRKLHSDNLHISGADSFYFVEMKIKWLKTFENAAALKILDVGCGDGVTEIYINKFFPGWEITAIDISEKSINEANGKTILNCNFSVYNGKNIPAPDESFDIIFIAGVLHHVNFSLHNDLIKEVSRVIKKSGRLYLFEHNPINPLTKYLVKTCVFDKSAKLLKSRYTIKLLKSNNFYIYRKKFIIFMPRNGVWQKLLFLEKFLHWLPLGGQYFIVATRKT